MGAVALKPNQLELIRRTIASDCNDAEFDLFMEAAKSYGLDPFRRQIIPLVFSKGDEKKRRMSIVVSRDGLRVVAQRCKDYRPASEKADVVFDESLVGPTNPKGLVSATVRLWKQDSRGEWYPVAGEAHWDEFAPITFEAGAFDWIETGETWPDTGRPKKRKVLREGAQPTLDQSGNWARMPVLMLTKCAESQALRAGWPDQFAGLYGEEEMEQAVAQDLNASEILEHEAANRRLKKAGAENVITFSFEPSRLESVPLGSVADRCVEFIKEADPEDVYSWSVTNADPLRQFWALAPSDALEIKKQIEAKTEDFTRRIKSDGTGQDAA